ncbi:hypothetical protein V6N12_049246 [Hibiscus sabdariffa]|uniref:Uncharacterized protein n=1 Tax=Hibiscus sabdariffa TaxID=183260 RepID=A0ABR2EJM8_9ROSI
MPEGMQIWLVVEIMITETTALGSVAEMDKMIASSAIYWLDQSSRGIDQREKSAMNRLRGVQRALDKHITSFLVTQALEEQLEAQVSF